MIVKWKTERGYAQIKRQECTRETPISVWFMQVPWSIGATSKPAEERKATKMGGKFEYHETWESARLCLLVDADEKVLAARRHLEICNSYYGNVKGLKEPVEQEEKHVFSK